jgi:putative copper export protein
MSWLGRWLLFAGTLTMIGALVAPLLAQRYLASGLRINERRHLARLGVLAAGTAVLGIALVFSGQLIAFRDPFVPWRDDAAFLLSSAWGKAWIFGSASALLGLGAFVAAHRSFVGRRLAGAAALALACYPALSGHAATGPLPWSIIADAGHVIAAGVWLGALPALALLVRRRMGEAQSAGLSELFAGFTPIALASAAGLTLTGAFATVLHIGSPAVLLSSAYGRWWLVKLSLFGVVVLLGAWNWRRAVPRLRSGEAESALQRSIWLEASVALLVLAATAVLVATAPP